MATWAALGSPRSERNIAARGFVGQGGSLGLQQPSRECHPTVCSWAEGLTVLRCTEASAVVYSLVEGAKANGVGILLVCVATASIIREKPFPRGIGTAHAPSVIQEKLTIKNSE